MTKKSKKSKKADRNNYSRIWHLSHINYTGRFLPRAKTAYPALLMIVLLVGVFIFTWSKIVVASVANYNVTASVVAPVPKNPATIISPINNFKTTSSQLQVTGYCQAPSYVVLYRNNIFSGVALCSINNSWSLQLGLLPGMNDLQTKIYSLNDQAGPLSPIYYVNYNVVANPSILPLFAKSTFTYSGVYVGQTFNLPIDIEGGYQPYALDINWGDRSAHTLMSRSSSGMFQVFHIYSKAGGYRGSYSIIINISDSKNNHSVLQLLAIVNNQNVFFGATSNSSNSLSAGPSNAILAKLIKFIWPSYGIVILMLFSFWLGEKQEYQKIKTK